MELAGRCVIITGGASGLGEATAREFLDAGARVVISDVHEPRSGSLGEADESQLLYCRADVTSEDEVARVMDQAVDRFGSIHGVVQCAGILAASRIVGREGPHALDLFRRVIEVNLIGTFNVMRLAAQRMMANAPTADGERGVIINTASISAYEGQIGQAAYSASKGGVASMTLPAAREFAPQGIRVVAIAPGVFRTAMIDAAPDKVQQSLEQQTLFPSRLGKPAEFAQLARHIVENPMLNGTIIRLDGAMRMGPK